MSENQQASSSTNREKLAEPLTPTSSAAHLQSSSYQNADQISFQNNKSQPTNREDLSSIAPNPPLHSSNLLLPQTSAPQDPPQIAYPPQNTSYSLQTQYGNLIPPQNQPVTPGFNKLNSPQSSTGAASEKPGILPKYSHPQFAAALPPHHKQANHNLMALITPQASSAHHQQDKHSNAGSSSQPQISYETVQPTVGDIKIGTQQGAPVMKSLTNMDYIDATDVSEEQLQELLQGDKPLKFDWEGKWLRGDQYEHMLKHIEAYSRAFGMEMLPYKTHPDNIYLEPINGQVYFVRANSIGSDFGFPRLGIKKHYKWKKMNFTTDLPKRKPKVSYIVASANRCEKFFPGKSKEGPMFRMHAVILQCRHANGKALDMKKSVNDGKKLYICCHLRRVELGEEEQERQERQGGASKQEIQKVLVQEQPQMMRLSSHESLNQPSSLALEYKEISEKLYKPFQYFLQKTTSTQNRGPEKRAEMLLESSQKQEDSSSKRSSSRRGLKAQVVSSSGGQLDKQLISDPLLKISRKPYKNMSAQPVQRAISKGQNPLISQEVGKKRKRNGEQIGAPKDFGAKLFSGLRGDSSDETTVGRRRRAFTEMDDLLAHDMLNVDSDEVEQKAQKKEALEKVDVRQQQHDNKVRLELVDKTTPNKQQYYSQELPEATKQGASSEKQLIANQKLEEEKEEEPLRDPFKKTDDPKDEATKRLSLFSAIQNSLGVQPEEQEQQSRQLPNVKPLAENSNSSDKDSGVRLEVIPEVQAEEQMRRRNLKQVEKEHNQIALALKNSLAASDEFLKAPLFPTFTDRRKLSLDLDLEERERQQKLKNCMKDKLKKWLNIPLSSVSRLTALGIQRPVAPKEPQPERTDEDDSPKVSKQQKVKLVQQQLQNETTPKEKPVRGRKRGFAQANRSDNKSKNMQQSQKGGQQTHQDPNQSATQQNNIANQPQFQSQIQQSHMFQNPHQQMMHQQSSAQSSTLHTEEVFKGLNPLILQQPGVQIRPSGDENENIFGLRRRSSHVISESVSFKEGGPRDREDSITAFKKFEGRYGGDTQHDFKNNGGYSPTISPQLQATNFRSSLNFHGISPGNQNSLRDLLQQSLAPTTRNSNQMGGISGIGSTNVSPMLGPHSGRHSSSNFANNLPGQSTLSMQLNSALNGGQHGRTNSIARNSFAELANPFGVSQHPVEANTRRIVNYPRGMSACSDINQEGGLGGASPRTSSIAPHDREFGGKNQYNASPGIFELLQNNQRHKMSIDFSLKPPDSK